MTISGFNAGFGWASVAADRIGSIKSDLDVFARQMATGKIAASYAELGDNVARTIDLRAHLASLDTFSGSISAGKTSLGIASQALTSFTQLAGTAQQGALNYGSATEKAGRSSAQTTLRTLISTMLDYVNTNDSGNYVFGGRETTLPPALDVNSILDGTPGKAGLIQYVAERRQADSGSNGLGRLALTSDLSGTTISLSEEASGLPFGFKLASVSSTLSSVSSSGPSGTPNTVTLAFSGQPAADQAVTVTVGLPDGTSTDLTLKAATVSGTGAFVIGVDAVATAENFKNALSAALKTTTSTQLANASTIKASQDFFAGSTTSPPKRVALGPDGTAATASSYITDATANAANTVTWYQGTDAKASGDPRLDRVARISAGVTVGLGVRANESGIANSLAAVAASVVAGYSTSDEKLAQAQFADVRERSLKALSTANGQAQDIVIGLASSQTAIKSIDAERTATQSVIQTTLSSIEDASPEKTAAAITALETQLQATYQVTSKLLKLSLADYL